MNAHDFSFRSIDGSEFRLADWAGHPLLVVNTASECGYTPQYADLQKLWQRYRERGLVVLGVPSNDFGAQEPGGEAQIKAFCETRYGVDFPLAAKHAVAGDDVHPFFRWIEDEFGESLRPRWNFHKFLVGPDGDLLGAWPSRVEPLAKEIVDAIEDALGD